MEGKGFSEVGDVSVEVVRIAVEFVWDISRVGFFSDKCEMCLKVVGRNNYIFYVIYKSKITVILSRILAIFLHFSEILNFRDKNEIYCF